MNEENNKFISPSTQTIKYLEQTAFGVAKEGIKCTSKRYNIIIIFMYK